MNPAHLSLQIEQAAQCSVSGFLSEWPDLKKETVFGKLQPEDVR